MKDGHIFETWWGKIITFICVLTFVALIHYAIYGVATLISGSQRTARIFYIPALLLLVGMCYWLYCAFDLAKDKANRKKLEYDLRLYRYEATILHQAVSLAVTIPDSQEADDALHQVLRDILKAERDGPPVSV